MKVQCLPHAFQMSPTRRGLTAALVQRTLQVKIFEQQSLGVVSRLAEIVGSFLVL